MASQRPKVVFDTLEPRVLLNADVLAVNLAAAAPQQQAHDVVIQLVDPAGVAAAPRVEVVDRGNSAVLASADLAGLQRVSIAGGAGADTLTIDAASFAGRELPNFTFAGGEGADTLIWGSAEAATWTLREDGSGAISGPANVSFDGVQNFVGGGADTLIGAATDADWRVEGAGSGSVGAFVFSGFANLIGAADNSDTFTFSTSGSLAGAVDGGAGGFDTLVLDVGVAQSLVSTATGADSGIIAFDRGLVAYRGLEPVTISGVVADLSFDLGSLAGNSGGVQARLNDAGTAVDGVMTLESLNGKFESQTFSAPTHSLTVRGGSGSDSVDIASLDSTFHAALSVNTLLSGYDPFDEGGLLPGDNHLTHKSVVSVSGDISLHGGALTLQADTIYVGTVADQTGSSGSWTAGASYAHVAATGGAGAGAEATIVVDADGVATARLSSAGAGYSVGDMLTFAPSGGGSVTMTLRNVASSAIVSTELAGGNAGEILFGRQKTNADGTTSLAGGARIALGPDAQLLAEADTAHGRKAGKISLATSDVATRLVIWPGDFTAKDAAIDIQGATLRGGSFKVNATAKDVNLNSDAPASAAGFTGSLTSLLGQIPGVVLSAATGIDLSVILRGADAKINVDDATIIAEGTVDIKAETKVDTQVFAIASALGSGGLAKYTGLEFAGGYGLAQSDVEANIGGSTTIDASGSITITAKGSTATKTVARASSNIVGTVDPNASSIAIAIAHTDLTALATVGVDAAITSHSGNVNVIANGATKTTPDASTISAIDGRAGVGVALAFEFGTVKASLDGTIKAAGTAASESEDTKTFDPVGGVDPSTDIITLPKHGFANGQAVVYTPYLVNTSVAGSTVLAVQGQQSDAVGGLEKGKTYYVIVVDQDHIQLSKEPSIDLDPSSVDPTATQTLNAVKAKLFDIDAIDPSADAIHIAAHGFETGDQVSYDAGGATAITGLADKAVYTVDRVDDASFRLKDSSGNVVQIAQGSALGTQSFTRASDNKKAEVTLARVDANGRIHVKNHGFAIGTPVDVTYDSLSEDDVPLGGVQAAHQYKLVATDADTFELRDAQTNARITLTDPGSAATHAFAYIGAVKSFDPSTAVDGSLDTIAIANHGFKSGDAVIYAVDPTKSTTLSRAFELDAIDATAKTIHIAGHGFSSGDQVTYDAGGSTPIGGLTSGAVYMVQKVSDDLFQLKDTNGVLVSVAQGAALGAHSFVNAATQTTASVTLARIDTTTNRIYLQSHGFVATAADPLLVDYASLETLGAHAVGGLQSGHQYKLVVVDADSFELRDATTGALVTLADPGAASMHVIAEDRVYQASQGNVHDLTAGDREIRGLTAGEQYYVVKVDDNHIRLVEDASEVSAVKPIDLTSDGKGADHALAASTNTIGIGVQAILDSQTRGKAKPEVGGKFNPTKYKDILSKPDIALATIFGQASATSGKKTVTDPNTGKDVTKDITNDGLSAGGAIAVNVVINDVEATIGKNATAAKPTTLQTDHNVEALATSTQRTQLISQSDVSKSKTKSTTAVAVDLSFAVGVYLNDANAIIAGNTIIDAGETVKVASSLSYPFLINPLDLVLGIPQDIVTRGVSGLTDLLDGTFGVSSKFMNTWVMARAKAQDTQATSVSGSIAVNVYIDHSTAVVQSGARINQSPPSAGYNPAATQSVTVMADVMMQFAEMAGIGKWSLSESPFGKAKFENKKAGELLRGGDVVDVFGRSGSKAIGGSILVDDIENTVYARIEGDAKVGIGASGALTIHATEDIFRLAIAQSGGKTDDGGQFAFAGNGLALRQRSDVEAGLVATASFGPTVTGGGGVDIAATTGGTEVEIAGTIIVAGKGSNGLGMSALVNDVERKVFAFIGADPSKGGDPNATPVGAVSMNVGDTSLSATTTGVVVGVVGTATVLTGPQGAPQNLGSSANDPLDGISLPALFEEAPKPKSGYGVAGSAGINFIRDTDLAYINARGALSVGTLSLTADNTQTIVAIVGGVAVSVNAGTGLGGGTTIGGAFAFNQLTADTEAFIADDVSGAPDANGLVIASHAAALATRDEISLKATRGGTLASFSAAVSANTNEQGDAFAGSVSVNRIVDTTKATIDGAKVSANGNAALTARDEAQLIAIGGGASYTAGAKGVGASLGFNQLSANTIAGVLGEKRRSALTLGGDLSILAIDDQTLWAFAVSLGIATGGGVDSKAVAFTLGINIISTDEKIFGRDNSAPILATIQNADVIASGVSLEAKDNSVIYAVAGALGVGSQGQAYGVGLGWNQIALQVRATVDNSSITAGAGGISLIAHSTQDGPISVAGKIAAAAVGGSKGNGATVGASLSVNGVYNTIEAVVSNSSTLRTTAGAGGSVSVRASDESTINALTGGVAISSSGSAVGAAISANYIANQVTAKVDGSTIDSNGDAIIDAEETAAIHSLTLGGAGGDNVSFASSLSINVIDNTVTAAVVGATSNLSARNNLRVTADDTANIVAIAGGLAAGGDVGVGLAATNVTILDTTKAYVDGAATLSAGGAGAAFTDVGGQSRRGLSIEANAGESVVIIGVGGAFAGDGAGAGALTLTYIDVSALAFEDAPSVTPAAGAGLHSDHDVDIVSHGHLSLVGVAGAIAGSEVGIGAGADAGYVKRRLEAYIGAGATAKGGDNVIVNAQGDMTVTSVSAAVAGASTGAGGLTTGVSVLDLAGKAHIDAGAVVRSDGNVLVSAEDDTTLDQVSGNIAAAGTGAGGIAAGVGYVKKTTEAYIAAGASVTALAKSGKSGIVADTGEFGAPPATANAQQQGVYKDFATSAVDYGADAMHVAGHGFSTGQEVIYTGQSLALGGLQTGGHYYVIRIDDNHFALAANKADALNGHRIDLVDTGVAATARHVVQTLNSTGVPSISNKNFNDPTLANNRDRKPLVATQSGVIIVAVSVNDLTSAGVGVAIAGEGSGALAGSVSVHEIDTLAHIGQGARINADEDTGAGAGQNVLVAAGRAYNGLAIGGGLAGSGGFSVAPAFAAPVLKGATEAFVQGATTGNAHDTIVNAAGDVAVVSHAVTDVLSIAAGIAASGEVALAGSAAVVVIDTSTIASISGRVRVSAVGDVLVAAKDDTTTYAIGGAVGVGIGSGGGAGAVDVTSIEKTTMATIDDHAIVDAYANSASFISDAPDGTYSSNGGFSQKTARGVAVLAATSEKIVSVGASLGAGAYAGIAGSVTVELVDSDTLAMIGDGAQINQNTAATAANSQSVIVAATNKLDLLNFAGGLGASLGAGVGASVDVGVLRNDTQALIGAASVRAKGDTDVFALSRWIVNANAISAGAGLVGLGGGIVVYSVGGNFTDSYSTSGGSSSALSGDNSTVLSFVESTVGTLSGRMQTSDASSATFDPAQKVNSAADTIDLGADRGLKTGDAVVYDAGGGNAIKGLKDGEVYFVIIDSAHPQLVNLAASYEDAQAGHAIDIDAAGASGSAHNLAAGNAQIANMARSASTANTPAGRVNSATKATSGVTSGTTAGILQYADIATGNLDVISRQALDLTARAGGVAGGAAALGVGLGVVSIDADSTAFIAPQTTITGLDPAAGVLTVSANLDSNAHVLGFAGAVSGFVSLGGAVSLIDDNSSARAMLGATPGASHDDSSTIEASSLVDATIVTGFRDVSVKSIANVNHFLADGAWSVAGVAGLGAAVGKLTIAGTSQAIVGRFTQIGSNAAQIVGDVTIDAQRTVTVNPLDANQPMGIAIGGGIIGAAAGATLITVNGAVAARIGDDAAVYAGGEVDVHGTSTTTANNLEIDGGAIGGIAVGVVIAQAKFAPIMAVGVGKRAVIRSCAMDVKAMQTTSVKLRGYAAGGGIASGQGLDIELEIDPTMTVAIDDGADIAATQSASVQSVTSTTSFATGDAGNYGGATVIEGGATSTLKNANSVSVGAGAHIAAGTSLTVLADSTNYAKADGDGGAGAIVSVIGATSTVNASDATTTTIGGNAQLAAGGDLSVESRTSSTGKSAPHASAGGLGADTRVTGNLTYGGATKTDIGASTLTAGGKLDVLARVTTLDLKIDAVAESSALGANSEAHATLSRPESAPGSSSPTSDALVDLHSGASVNGGGAVNVKARHESVTSLASADATTNGLGASTNSYAKNDFDVTTRVVAESGGDIHTRALTVEAYGSPNVSGFVDASSHGALIDTGDEHPSETVAYQRTIDFNADVFLSGPPAPELVIDAAGNIVKKQGIGTVTLQNGVFIVPDIVNTSTAAGTATFSIPSWGQDPTPAGYDTTPGEDSIKGAPKITFLTAFDHVLIQNASNFDVRIGLINPLAATPNFAQNVVVDVTYKKDFLPVTTADPGHTAVTISNTSTAARTKVTLNDAILDALGPVSISTANGDIVANANGRIEATTLSLSVPDGAIGSTASPIRTVSTRLDALARDGIFVSETGDLALGSARSTGGVVSLAATGSILDADVGVAVNVSAPTLILNAGGGSIGAKADALRIDADRAANSFTASTEGDVVAADVAGGVGVATVASTSGDILLSTHDSNAIGEDIIFGAASFMSATTGAVSLAAGDNIVMAVGAMLNAAETATLTGDAGDADSGVGALIDLEGVIAAAAVSVVGGVDRDTIVIRGVAANAPATVASGGAEDVILVGSRASATTNASGEPTGTSNVGGNLATIVGTLTVTGASDGLAALDLDNSGFAQGVTGTVSDSEIAGFGMTGEVVYSDLRSLALHLGAGADTATVRSTAAATVTSLFLGDGADSVIVSGADATVNSVAGALILDGGAGGDTLLVDDNGDTVANVGVIGGANGNRIYGFGMGGADQTAVDPNVGVTYGDFATVTVKAGSGADAMTIAASSTDTIVDAGAGADAITLGPNLANIGGHVLARGGGDAGDAFSVSPTIDSNLTLDAVSATRGRITAVGMAQPVEFEGVDATTIALSGATTNNVTINGSATPIVVDANGAVDKIFVHGAGRPTTINLGAGLDEAIVYGTSAPLLVTGAGDFAKLTVDLSGTPAATTTGVIRDGAVVGEGIASGLTVGDVTFRSLAEVDAKLGDGNDTFTLDVHAAILPATVLGVFGGGGDDLIEARSVGAARTIVDGQSGKDTLQVEVSAQPIANQFTSFDKTVEQLIIDNSANATTPIAWTLLDTDLQAATLPSGSPVSVISTAGADLTRILGGKTGTDTLDVVSTTTANVNVMIDNNRITLQSGLVVVTQPDPANDFDTYRNYDKVLNFDGLNQGDVAYASNGFRLSTSNALGLIRSDAISPAAQARANDDALTLAAAKADGTPNGDGFTLYSLELANTAPSGTAVVVLSGHTIGGQTVTAELSLAAGAGFQRFDTSLASFYGLDRVTLTAKDASTPFGSILVDNIVAVDDLPNAAATVAPATVPTYTISSDFSIDTTVYSGAWVWINSGKITVDYNNGGAAVDDIIDFGNGGWWYVGDVRSGFSITPDASASGSNSGLISVNFAGDLSLPAGRKVSAAGANALSFNVANNVQLADNVTFDLSAHDQTAGAGGGAAGGSGGAGSRAVGGYGGGGGSNGSLPSEFTFQGTTSAGQGVGGPYGTGDNHGGSGGYGSPSYYG
ncbi:LEPR-XLL domain-containing protein, partial [Methylosinus sporium]